MYLYCNLSDRYNFTQNLRFSQRYKNCVKSDLKPLSLPANKRGKNRIYLLCWFGVYLLVTDKHNGMMLPKVLCR